LEEPKGGSGKRLLKPDKGKGENSETKSPRITTQEPCGTEKTLEWAFPLKLPKSLFQRPAEK